MVHTSDPTIYETGKEGTLGHFRAIQMSLELLQGKVHLARREAKGGGREEGSLEDVSALDEFATSVWLFQPSFPTPATLNLDLVGQPTA